MTEISVMESIHDENERLARQLNRELSGRDIFAVNVMGAPGVGKTTSLTHIIRRIESPACVVEGDIESDIDTRALKALGIEAVQINTGGACHLDCPQISRASNQLELEPGFMFIENVGNLVCPAEFMIGEHVKLLIVSVTDGSDKPYKYPLAFEKADAILVNKSDLAAYVDFDGEYFLAGVRKQNKTAPVFNVSGKTGEGFDEVAHWLETAKNGFFAK